METGITSISIENFKGIGEKVTIPLKPITLLFGANSAGKSTVLHAIALARTMLEKGSSCLPVECCGHTIPLGSYSDFLHKHDDSKTLAIEFFYSLGENGLPTIGHEENQIVDGINNFSVRMEYRSQEYTIRFNDQVFCKGVYNNSRSMDAHAQN